MLLKRRSGRAISATLDLGETPFHTNDTASIPRAGTLQTEIAPLWKMDDLLRLATGPAFCFW